MVANVSDPPKSSRGGTVGVLAIFAALVAAYFGICLTGLGLPGPGPSAPSSDAAPARTEGKAAGGEARGSVVVQGEQCKLAADAAPRDCKAVCQEVTGKTVDVDATGGAQRTVDALRTCLQARGLKVSVQSE
jgi:hypothetical protein